MNRSEIKNMLNSQITGETSLKLGNNIYYNNIFYLYSSTPSIFWIPAKHNDKSLNLLKSTQE